MPDPQNPVVAPRLSAAEITALGTPEDGWVVWNTTADQLQVANGGAWGGTGGGGGGGVTDHGALTGLGDDDHPQYTTAAELAAFAQPLDSDLTAIAALSTTAFGRALLELANAAALRTAAELGTAAQAAATDFAPAAAVDYLVGTSTGSLGAEIAVGTTPGGELGGTWASPTVDASHSGSTHAAVQAAAEATAAAALAGHTGDTSDAHDASAVSFVPYGTVAATDVQAAIQEMLDEGGGGGAPSTVDYLVGTASGGLSAEIVVGTSPGGELGGTWASPTVDASHSGSTHAAVQAAAEATAAGALATHEADTTSIHGIADTSALVTTARALTAGAGLTGGGDLSADRTFDVGAGANIVANANDVAVVDIPTYPYAPGSFTVATERYAIMSNHLKLTTTQRATLAGTARLRIGN